MRIWAWRSIGLCTPALLAACGGSGGGINSPPAPPAASVPDPAPPPVPAPMPAPAPTPAPSNNDTSEYRTTIGAVSMNALAAYDSGATGRGVAIGIIDSGLDQQTGEFAGRISAASRDVAGNADYGDVSGHGTAVTFVAAGARNGLGAQGVAFDASIIVLRADRPGSCTPTTTSDDSTDSCSFPSSAIATGVDAARTGGARVINMSLGGAAMSPDLVAAIGRATQAGLIIVIAAGNDGTAEPDPFTFVAGDPAARNQVIIAGSVDSADQISSFSDRAGSGAAHFLAAVGERVRAPCEGTKICLWSGTSFAAPQVSGAVALLAQAFPNLSGAQIVDILYRSARDAGAAGVDPVYGQGIIDLTRAFQPIGSTALAGTTAAVSLGANAQLSAAMGDAPVGALGAVILDGYSRAYAVDLAQSIAHATPTRLLGGVVQAGGRQVALSASGMTLAMTLTPVAHGEVRLLRTELTEVQARQSRAIAGMVTQRLGANTALAFGIASGASALSGQLTGRAEPAYLIARGDAQGFETHVKGSTAIRQRLGSTGITATAENGDVLSRSTSPWVLRSSYQRSRYERFSLGVDRTFGALAAQLSASTLGERDSVLGARFGAGLGGARATTRFVDAAFRWRMGNGWSVGGNWRQGWSAIAVRGGLRGGGTLRSRAFAADIGKNGLFGGDSGGLRLAQPLRVTGGGLNLVLPTGYDYVSAEVDGWTARRLDLTPAGRELDMEARYARPLLGGLVETNLYWRRDSGNIAGLNDDYGMAMRYGFRF